MAHGLILIGHHAHKKRGQVDQRLGHFGQIPAQPNSLAGTLLRIPYGNKDVAMKLGARFKQPYAQLRAQRSRAA